MPMLVSTMRAGERRILNGFRRPSDKPLDVAFTLICVTWFRSPTVLGAFFHGAMVVTGDGIVAILDPITLEFTRPLLALPAPGAIA